MSKLKSKIKDGKKTYSWSLLGQLSTVRSHVVGILVQLAVEVGLRLHVDVPVQQVLVSRRVCCVWLTHVVVLKTV